MRIRGTPIGKIRKHHLGNGLTVLTQENYTTPIVTTMIWYRVGSRVEKPGASGISHFLEHMMFKGAGRYRKGEIDWLTARFGGANNASTSKDCTAYYFQFAHDYWEVGLEIEAERMVHNQFAPKELELERKVVVEELKMERDCPWSHLRQQLEAACFTVHPYGLPVIGRLEDVQRIRAEQVVEHYQRFYTPTNAVLVIAGAFETDRVLQRIDNLFGTFPSRPIARISVATEPSHDTPIRVELKDHSEVPRLLLAFPSPSVLEAEHYEMQILERILAEGRLSRLYRRLIDDLDVGLSVGTEFSFTLDPYLFFIWLELRPDADSNHVEQLVVEELDRLGAELVSEEELNRAKNHCWMALLGDFETTLDSAGQLGLLESLDRVEYWQDFWEKLRQVTASGVRRVARRYLTPQRMVVGVLRNGKSGAD